MHMTDIGKRITQLRKAAGFSQAELARRCGWKSGQSRIGNYEKGTRSPSLDDLPRIAKALNVDVTDLVGKAPTMHGNTEVAHVPPSTRRAPVISWVQAGSWTEAIDLYQPGFSEEWEDVNACDSPNVFWLRVVGDSMTRPHGISVPEGYLIKVDPDRQADNGSLVVAKLTESQDATFKKLVIDAGRKLLMPLNERYDPIPINGNCRIVGVVTEIKLKLG